jgi:hypothetical protein
MATRFLQEKAPDNENDQLTLQTGKVESLQKSCSQTSTLVNSPFARQISHNRRVKFQWQTHVEIPKLCRTHDSATVGAIDHAKRFG